MSELLKSMLISASGIFETGVTEASAGESWVEELSSTAAAACELLWLSAFPHPIITLDTTNKVSSVDIILFFIIFSLDIIVF
nr:hypothetical protein [Clostridia bacterium]